jgi:hypothetical protein
MPTVSRAPSAERRATVGELRRLLAERFPAAERRSAAFLPTGAAAIDRLLGGGLPRGALSEIVAGAPSCGAGLLVQLLLASARSERRLAAVIDAADGFDPCSSPADRLAHLLWVRCHGAAHAMQAADLLVRDGNFGLIILDLRGLEERELRRQPTSLWFRLQRAIEASDGSLALFADRPLAPSASVRLRLESSFSLAALSRSEAESAAALEATAAKGARAIAA